LTDSSRSGGPDEKILPAPGTNRLQDLFNSARSRAEKKIMCIIPVTPKFIIFQQNYLEVAVKYLVIKSI